MTRGLRQLLIGVIVLGYAATLAVSSSHLAQWYRATGGDLHPFLPLALALTLEVNAFLLSLMSNSVLRRSAWARFGAVAALGLVWLGNLLSMQAHAPGAPFWQILAASAFVPLGTYVMGKVLRELLDAEGGAREPAGALEAPKEPEMVTLLGLLDRPTPLSHLYQRLPHLRHRLPELLKRMEALGMVENQRGYWTRKENWDA